MINTGKTIRAEELLPSNCCSFVALNRSELQASEVNYKLLEVEAGSTQGKMGCIGRPEVTVCKKDKHLGAYEKRRLKIWKTSW